MSGSNEGRVFPLSDRQGVAVDPVDSVWLSAAAGTGKTQVLSARVLRLLLREGVAPEQILCLTFTKAGAAEMANRVNAVLAQWVRMPDEALGADLLAIGASNREDVRTRARSLFARVLDTPSGGLRIDTIHAFAQWLLSAFPEEAGLTPGTQALEDRDREPLAQRTLAELLDEWRGDGKEQGETAMLDALGALSMRFGPDGAQSWLMRCAKASDLWLGEGGWPDDLRGRLLRVLAQPADLSAETVAVVCSDAVFNVSALQSCIDGLEAWGTKTAGKAVPPLKQWLALSASERAGQLDLFAGTLFTKGSFDGLDLVPAGLANIEKKVPGYGVHAESVAASLRTALETQRAVALVEWLVPALRVGRRFALRWDEVKRRDALMDYDDQIRLAANLLQSTDTRWIQYKLDRNFDHILLDEAQDTNVEQWSIIKALVDDYFDGAGQRDGRLRTLFVVGDYKQAIFGFQGTSPENFRSAKDYFQEKIASAAANAAPTKSANAAQTLAALDLAFSYRTSQPILDVVDDAIEAIGPECFGLDEVPAKHTGDADRPGEVVLWEPILAQPDDDDTQEDGDDTWLPAPERRMADKIAGQIKAWLKNGYPLYKGTVRNAGPGDIMVLVRSRKELAGLVVSRLFAAGIPVAGVDRLRLGAPLVVKDMLAALRFAAQPRDDLTLANLLVSPLIGWSQEDLLEHGYRKQGVPLWRHLRDSDDAMVAATVGKLKDLLGRADYEPVQALLHWMLVGPWRGRAALTARLGSEANDAIDELLNVAAAYEAAHTASLLGFLHWFDGGDGELKREAGERANEVRVLTVHGAKGLQAPIVILADATANPDRAATGAISLADGTRSVPLPHVSKGESVAAIDDAVELAKARDREEHWRLLYVAMTRAEEALFVGGALGVRDDEPAPDSWYARLAPLMPHGTLRRGKAPASIVAECDVAPSRPVRALPAWATAPVGPEPRPPRPLAPSRAGEDETGDAPSSARSNPALAKRGILIHALLERLPQMTPNARVGRAEQWLARHEPELSGSDRAEIVAATLRVLETPEFIEIFAPEGLAEIPIAATVAGQVIIGTIDRLVVSPDAVLAVDFKTARNPPQSAEAIPDGTCVQMGAYVAALEVIYPGRSVRAAVLYTQTPALFTLTPERLAVAKAALSAPQQGFPDAAVEAGVAIPISRETNP